MPGILGFRLGWPIGPSRSGNRQTPPGAILPDGCNGRRDICVRSKLPRHDAGLRSGRSGGYGNHDGSGARMDHDFSRYPVRNIHQAKAPTAKVDRSTTANPSQGELSETPSTEWRSPSMR